mmetsp:Transcript_26641/g.43731  ORF Transcript_26641/g.43731 Transcript_26641/m.43731 type:complete len:93 (-) Transcript_26641:595-873(-)
MNVTIRQRFGVTSMTILIALGCPNPTAHPYAARQTQRDMKSGATEMPKALMVMNIIDITLAGRRPSRSPNQPPRQRPGILPAVNAVCNRPRS